MRFQKREGGVENGAPEVENLMAKGGPVTESCITRSLKNRGWSETASELQRQHMLWPEMESGFKSQNYQNPSFAHGTETENRIEHEAPEMKNKRMDNEAPQMEMEGKGAL